MQDLNSIIQTLAHSAPGFLLAVVIHEYAHGWMAKKYGDPTAERLGRLTFNPAVHIDMVGTVIFPLIGVLLNFPVFGWAKPVPVDTRNFKAKEYKKAIFWVSFAGALANFVLGSISALLLALIYVYVPESFTLKVQFVKMLQFSVIINFLLGGFNLIPIPPLDGSKMLAVFLKGEMLRTYESIAQYTNLIFLGIIALSFAGINTISYIIYPFISFGQKLIIIFIGMLQ